VAEQPVALIVGAGDFIGAAIARRFAAGGFTVAAARRNGDKLAPLIAEIERSGGSARGYTLDARDEAQVVELFAELERSVGALEVVVFNIGPSVPTSIETASSGYHCTDGRRMDSETCPSLPKLLNTRIDPTATRPGSVIEAQAAHRWRA
jgi:NAD(P)-dependent dehydrogenase (short-subunit alcohol dehydrogenase family)